MKTRKGTRRHQQPRRFRAARASAGVGSTEKAIARAFNLPVGAVRLVAPEGEFMDSDESIENVRKGWHDAQEKYLWPPQAVLNFYKRGELRRTSRSRRFDLSDDIMHFNEKSHLAFTLGVRTSSPDWTKWTVANIEKIEWLIRYQLNVEAWNVTAKRKTAPGSKCSNEFRWALSIRPAASRRLPPNTSLADWFAG